MWSKLNSTKRQSKKHITDSYWVILFIVSRLSAVVNLKYTQYFLNLQLRLVGDVCSPDRAVRVIGVAARRCGVKPDRD
jgi:hypothetical protein